MKKGMIPKFSMGMALAAVLALGWAPGANADLDDAVSYTEPRGVLVMPFDVTANHESFQLVSRIGTGLAGDPIATHWSYWSKDCEHLADVFICLTDNDTVVVDPRNLQSEVQSVSPPENHKIGPIIRLKDVQGIVTVTAFEVADPDANDCRVDPLDQSTADDELVGAWTIANTSTNAAFGSDAIGLFQDTVPSAGSYLEAGMYIQTFNPQTLGDSSVILMGIEAFRGNGAFEETEVGPIRERGSPSVCCDVSITDNIEVSVSLPDVCFECAHFAPIASNLGADSLIPDSVTFDSSGFLHLANCSVYDDDGLSVPIIDESFDQFIFAYHGQAVGPFGAVVSGKYSAAF